MRLPKRSWVLSSGACRFACAESTCMRSLPTSSPIWFARAAIHPPPSRSTASRRIRSADHALKPTRGGGWFAESEAFFTRGSSILHTVMKSASLRQIALHLVKRGERNDRYGKGSCDPRRGMFLVLGSRVRRFEGCRLGRVRVHGREDGESDLCRSLLG